MSYVPPGWDRWFAVRHPGGRYRQPQVSDQGRVTEADRTVYTTDLIGREAVSFIRGTPAGEPLFLYWAPHAPHSPATPSARYRGTLDGLPRLRPPSYNEADVSDKPAYVRRLAPVDRETRARRDALRERMYEALRSVDDWIGEILRALRDTGRLRDTLIIFTSDNGLMLGEHRMPGGKLVPYEESIRVPFVLRWDAAGWAVPRRDRHLVANVDLAPTVAEAAGTQMPGAEGRSLLPILQDPSAPWRSELFLELANPPVPSWCALRGTRWVYVAYATGERELYDLRADPYQLDNLAADPGHRRVAGRMDRRLARWCSPPPPGFARR